ncbi:SUKH-4 family immunity protein [uncultured Chitinophaga sp.]|uniref:SUKH-4 family immunity protein n=1 Tax=uncultured Chitinophaga sp. TaxID=339340 RepID=UPI0025E85016|nr:SUKH-4 family immunity protein [uncultured Chitinophaga sp.]
MISIEDFKEKWEAEYGDSLQTFSANSLDGFSLDAATLEFLIDFGLPKSTAPFLSFAGNPDRGKYNLSCIGFLNSWFDFLDEDYSRYIAIGTDGSGDIIAVNAARNGRIDWIDHEDMETNRYMNGSIFQLAACLLAYNDFVKLTTQDNADFDFDFSDVHFETLKDILIDIDVRCTDEGFWKNELDTLLANREWERSSRSK